MQEMMYSKYTIAHNSHITEVNMNKELMANQFNMK